MVLQAPLDLPELVDLLVLLDLPGLRVPLEQTE